MRVRLDRARCVGHGRCYVLAPEVFEEDERGHCVVLLATVPDDLADDARRGVQNCPEAALSIEEEP